MGTHYHGVTETPEWEKRIVRVEKLSGNVCVKLDGVMV